MIRNQMGNPDSKRIRWEGKAEIDGVVYQTVSALGRGHAGRTDLKRNAPDYGSRLVSHEAFRRCLWSGRQHKLKTAPDSSRSAGDGSGTCWAENVNSAAKIPPFNGEIRISGNVREPGAVIGPV